MEQMLALVIIMYIHSLHPGILILLKDLLVYVVVNKASETDPSHLSIERRRVLEDVGSPRVRPMALLRPEVHAGTSGTVSRGWVEARPVVVVTGSLAHGCGLVVLL
jgi:hypothetical protein